jgi:hypothetical protein
VRSVGAAEARIVRRLGGQDGDRRLEAEQHRQNVRHFSKAVARFSCRRSD